MQLYMNHNHLRLKFDEFNLGESKNNIPANISLTLHLIMCAWTMQWWCHFLYNFQSYHRSLRMQLCMHHNHLRLMFDEFNLGESKNNIRANISNILHPIMTSVWWLKSRRNQAKITFQQILYKIYTSSCCSDDATPSTASDHTIEAWEWNYTWITTICV